MNERQVGSAKYLAKTRSVAQERAEHQREEETEVKHSVRHALVEHGEGARLADSHIGPLDNNDGNEEGTLGMTKSAPPVSVVAKRVGLREGTCANLRYRAIVQRQWFLSIAAPPHKMLAIRFERLDMRSFDEP